MNLLLTIKKNFRCKLRQNMYKYYLILNINMVNIYAKNSFRFCLFFRYLGGSILITIGGQKVVTIYKKP